MNPTMPALEARGVQAVLGHSTPATTRAVYAPDPDRRAYAQLALRVAGAEGEGDARVQEVAGLFCADIGADGSVREVAPDLHREALAYIALIERYRSNHRRA